MRLLTVSPDNPAANLAFDERLLACNEEVLRFWETAEPVVVVGRGGRIEEQVRTDACQRDGVPVLRRCSGGGAVVLAAGCLNYSLLFSLDKRPEWRNVRESVCDILRQMARALGAQVHEPSDLALDGRKVAGAAQRRSAGSLLHHGTLLYRFDADLAGRYLLEPQRQPEYRQKRTHVEFLGNLPFPAMEIERRVADAWRAQL